MKNYLYLILATVFAGCGSSQTFETENGTLITYVRKGSGEPSDTLISYFLLKYEKEGGKVLYETSKELPTPIKLDSGFYANNRGTFYEVIGKMKIGDNVNYSLPASELFIENFKGRAPDSVEFNDPIRVSVSFLSQVTGDEHTQKSLSTKRKQMLAQADKEQIAKDVKVIDNYLTANEIEAVKLECGIRYTLSEKGNGPRLKLGQNVNVHYAGYLLTGEYFDTSMRDAAQAQGLYNKRREPYDPFPISIYNSPVITGWHEGIYQLNKGAKATLYIPSPLGYGSRGSGKIIKPNSILVFDIEIVE